MLMITILYTCTFMNNIKQHFLIRFFYNFLLILHLYNLMFTFNYILTKYAQQTKIVTFIPHSNLQVTLE